MRNQSVCSDLKRGTMCTLVLFFYNSLNDSLSLVVFTVIDLLIPVRLFKMIASLL